jgi:glyoxylate/hydroxypyruvate reductase
MYFIHKASLYLLLSSFFFMSVVIIAPTRRTDHWKASFEKLYPNETLYTWPDVADPESVECALCWYHPEGSLLEFPNLKLVSSMGAGVDHLLKDPKLPAHLPVTRIVDELLTQSMNTFVMACLLHFHRRFFKYERDKKAKIWDIDTIPEIPIKVGILGIGALGMALAEKIKGIGIDVIGYSRNVKLHEQIPCYSGAEGLKQFLGQINVLVCLLPLTRETEGIINREMLMQLPEGSCLINVARGKHLVDDDLLWAMDNGRIAEAYLDVFHTEPLPKDHPFWERENVFISPHMASVTNPDAALPQVMENLHRIKNGLTLWHQVDVAAGY